MSVTYNVGVVGFSEKDIEKIDKILQSSQSKNRSYILAGISNINDIDVLIADIDAVTSKAQCDALLLKKPTIHIITASKKDKGETDNHIRGLLLATRVIRLLDNLQMSEKSTDGVVDGIADDVEIEVVTETDEAALNILIVDDSKMMQKTLELELNKSNIKMKKWFADDGEVALALIEETHFDFIFLDVMMPGIDGYETCSRIRKNKSMKKTPVIMLSAKTSPMDEVKGVMAGCTTYLTKPIDSNEFQRMLDRIMNWLQDFKKKQIN